MGGTSGRIVTRYFWTFVRNSIMSKRGMTRMVPPPARPSIMITTMP